MKIRLVIPVLVFCALPLAAWAQDTPPPPPTNDNNKAEVAKYADKKVTLTFEGVSMTTALRALMKTVEAEYLIAPALDKSIVNTKLTNIRFPIALELLLKSGTIPAEFTVTIGIFRFVPRKELPPTEPSDSTLELTQPEKEAFLPYIVKVPVENIEAARMAAFLSGNPFYSFETPNNIQSGSVTGHGNYSNNGFDNGTVIFGGSNFNRNLGNGSNQNSGNGFNFSNMLTGFLGNILGGNNRRR